jgi:hypothetical protein
MKKLKSHFDRFLLIIIVLCAWLRARLDVGRQAMQDYDTALTRLFYSLPVPRNRVQVFWRRLIIEVIYGQTGWIVAHFPVPAHHNHRCWMAAEKAIL